MEPANRATSAKLSCPHGTIGNHRGCRLNNDDQQALRESFGLVDEDLTYASDDEDLQTLAWCAEIARDMNFLGNFGFDIEGSTWTESPAEFEIPVVGNFGRQSITTWLSVTGALLEHDDRLRGLRFSIVNTVRLEVGPRRQKSAPWPEMVIGADWPTLLLSPDGYAQTDTDITTWDLQIRPL